MSFFTDFERENVDNNALINVLIFDPNLFAAPFQQAIVAPIYNLDFTQRFDWQLNEKNTLVARYGFEGSKMKNAGLGGFDLLSQHAGKSLAMRIARTYYAFFLNLKRIVTQISFA